MGRALSRHPGWCPPPCPSPTSGEGIRGKRAALVPDVMATKPSPLVGESWVGGRRPTWQAPSLDLSPSSSRPPAIDPRAQSHRRVPFACPIVPSQADRDPLRVLAPGRFVLAHVDLQFGL